MLSVRFALWAAAAGALIPVMAVLNARLGRALGEPLHAPVVLFGVGLLALLGSAWALTQDLPHWANLRQAQPMDFAGGLIVGFYVLSATLVAPRIGVGNFSLCAVVAQIVCATLVDQFGLFGAQVRPADWGRLSGIALLIVGLVITQVSASRRPTESAPPSPSTATAPPLSSPAPHTP